MVQIAPRSAVLCSANMVSARVEGPSCRPSRRVAAAWMVGAGIRASPLGRAPARFLRRAGRLAAALADQHAPGYTFAVSLELLSDVDELCEMRHRHSVGAHQGDGQAHQRKALEVVESVAHLDIAALAVRRIVEVAH